MRRAHRLRVVVASAGFPSIEPQQRILAGAGADVVDARELSGPQALAVCRDADAVLTDYFTWSAEAISELEHCRVICQYGVGLDQIDVSAATAAGILVTHTPEYCIEELAEHTLALLLAVARNVARYDRSVRAGLWDYNVAPTPRRLAGRTLGLIGFGRVGRAVAARAVAFGLRVVASDPYQPPGVLRKLGVEPLEQERLLAESDIVSLHAPLAGDTRGLLDARAIASMKRGAILLNTARGALVDQEALVEALRLGRLAGAGLDVLEREPPQTGEPLLELDNVVVTPHAGFLSSESIERVQIEAAEEVRRALAGEPLLFAVNEAAVGVRR